MGKSKGPLIYNLPGYGTLSTSLFPYTERLYEMLKEYGYDARLKRTSQLGILRTIFPGAHHTRYEYVFIQWALVSELLKIKNANYASLSLKTSREELGKLFGMDKFPTGAELLQVLILLANIGHLPETIASSRSLLHLLRTDNKLRMSFKSGLSKEDYSFFDEVLDDFQIYNVQYLTSLFMLQRHKRYVNEEFIDFPSKIIRSYINRESESEPLKKIWSLFDSIRRISYLTLDSHYAPVPFSINLASIILNIGDIVDEVIDSNSGFQNALKQLSAVMRDNVYMCGPSLLAQSKVTEKMLMNFDEVKEKTYSRIGIRDLIKPSFTFTEELSKVFNDQPGDILEPDWDNDYLIQLEYYSGISFSKKLVDDTVALEIRKRNKIGKSRVRVGVQLDYPRKHLNITYSLLRGITEHNRFKSIASTVSDIMSYELFLVNQGKIKPNYKNRYKCIEFALKAIFRTPCHYKFEVPKLSIDATHIGKGAKSTSKWLTNYILKIKKTCQISEDYEHELTFTSTVLSLLPYKGILLCFVGSTKISFDPNPTDSAEFDGIILFPNENPYEIFAVVIEAKNQSNGHTTGKKQLQKRLEECCRPIVEYDIKQVVGQGAYAILRLRK